MKKLTNSGLGAAAFLVFLTVAAANFSSCGNADSKNSSTFEAVHNHVIVALADSGLGTGNQPITPPKTNAMITVSCPLVDCGTAQAGSKITASGTSDSGSYVVEFQNEKAIPANTSLQITVSFAKVGPGSRVDSAMKK